MLPLLAPWVNRRRDYPVGGLPRRKHGLLTRRRRLGPPPRVGERGPGDDAARGPLPVGLDERRAHQADEGLARGEPLHDCF